VGGVPGQRLMGGSEVGSSGLFLWSGRRGVFRLAVFFDSLLFFLLSPLLFLVQLFATLFILIVSGWQGSILPGVIPSRIHHRIVEKPQQNANGIESLPVLERGSPWERL
jgi:hypothetical protein